MDTNPTNDNNDKSLTCNVCDKIFKTVGSYRYHLNIHTNPVICPYCDKKFSCRSFNYQTHIASHTKELKYNCTYCDKKCISPTTLTQHILKKHPETIEKMSEYRTYSTLPAYYKQFANMTPIELLLKAADKIDEEDEE